MKTLVRRLGATVAGGALASTALIAVSSSAPASAAPVTSPAAQAAVGWIAGELDGGLLGTSDAQITATLDLGLGLARTGLDPALLAQVKAGIDSVLTTYVGAAGDPAKAARVAKAASFYTLAGDPNDAAGIDLIDRLEGQIDDTTGQLASTWGVDLFNQGSAVLALDAAESDEAALATQFLLAGQCEDGGWGYETDDECVPDVDTTSLAVLGLRSQSDETAVSAALAAADTWLVSQQATDGSFGLTDFTPYNTNSTGLVAWALREVGNDASAAKAAAWVRAHQLVGTTCDLALRVERGAITYSDEALSSDLAYGLADRAETALATAQAFPALVLAPPATGSLKVTGARFVQAGKNATVTVTGVAAGERVCLTAGGSGVTVTGTGAAQKVALGTAKSAKAITLSTLTGTARSNTVLLGAKKLKPSVKMAVKRGAKQSVKVKGLAAGEKVTVKLGKKKVAGGKANAKGVFAKKFKVTAKRGKAKLTVTGQFANRKGVKGFRVK